LRSTAEPITLQYGTHVVRVERDDFEPWEEEIEIRSPTVDVNVVLQRIHRIARLIISTEPSGATIFVNGVSFGQSPVNVPVDMGVHTVRTELEGYVSITIPVNVDIAELRQTYVLQPRIPETEPDWLPW
jgi:hypothetical protein